MTFKKGQLILLDYTAKIKDSGEVFETTLEDEAKKHSLHESNVKYMPKLVSVGEGWVLKGLDDALSETTSGDKKTIEVSPDKGFGARDKGKVRMIPLRKLGEDAEKVSVGDTVEIDNKKGIIRFIGSGRVQVDYNHRYAGKTILYDINIKKSLDSDDEKISEILKSRLPIENEKVAYKKNGTIVDVTVPEEIFRADGLAIIKHFVQTDLFKFVTSLTKVNFVETYENKQTPKPKSEEKPKSK
ncbi:MAG: FKBP-type peptidyl-prolyl cis-trans isomerase [Thermoproteota archaeon]|nr:FKBP-type peptidyl-prolyl cis-trans isomerase [Thermoproteota archaeon]